MWTLRRDVPRWDLAVESVINSWFPLCSQDTHPATPQAALLALSRNFGTQLTAAERVRVAHCRVKDTKDNIRRLEESMAIAIRAAEEAEAELVDAQDHEARVAEEALAAQPGLMRQLTNGGPALPPA